MASSNPMNTSNQYVKYRITVTENSQSIDNNTSNVTVSVKFYRTNTGYQTWGTGTVYCKINGTTYKASVTPDQKITSSGIVLFTKTLAIKHNADGTKTLTCSAWISHDVLTSSEQSYSQTLTTIPRTSALTAGNGTLGTAQKLTIAKANSSFTHTITYQCGSASGTICTKSGSTSINWTPPLDLAEQNTSGTAVTVVLTISTYNGDTLIGSAKKTITCAIPAGIAPTCTVKVEDAAGYAGTYGGFVQGYSKAKVTITPSLSYDAEIVACKTVIGNITYQGTSFTTDVLTAAGSLTITTTVTDARGRTGTATTTLNVLAYEPPQIQSLNFRRCSDAAGNVPDDTGGYIQVWISAAVTPLNNKNTASYTLAYKKTADTAYTSIALSTLKNKYSVADSKFVFAADTEASFDIRLTVEDAFGYDASGMKVSTAFTLMHWALSGLSMAIGKVCELGNHWLDIGLRTMFRMPAYFAHNMGIYGTASNGVQKNVFNPQDAENNTIIGLDNCRKKDGITAVYGHDITLGISHVNGEEQVWKPYYAPGDVINLDTGGTYYTGYASSGKNLVRVFIPLSRPILGCQTVAMSGGSWTVYQNGTSYNVTPSKITASIRENGVNVFIEFSNVTLAASHTACGVYIAGAGIAFS